MVTGPVTQGAKEIHFLLECLLLVLCTEPVVLNFFTRPYIAFLPGTQESGNLQ